MWKKSQLPSNKQKPIELTPYYPPSSHSCFLSCSSKGVFVCKSESVYLIWVLPRWCHLQLFLSLFMHSKRIRQFQKKCVENKHNKSERVEECVDKQRDIVVAKVHDALDPPWGFNCMTTMATTNDMAACGSSKFADPYRLPLQKA